MNTPRVSVLMPVYNPGAYLTEAINCILAQTFSDFELILINDASTDNSEKIILSYTDPRIVYLRNEQNTGIVGALNRGIETSKGELLVRMDADDLVTTDRIEKLVKFMNQHPETGVASSYLKLFGNRNNVWEYSTSDDDIKAGLLFTSTLAHAPCVIRKQVLIENNIRYSDHYPHMEDYVLWHSLKHKTQFACIPEVLYFYRITGENITEVNRETYFNRVSAYYKVLLKELDISPSETELKLHFGLDEKYYPANKKYIHLYHNWLLKLKAQNRKTKIYPEAALERIINQKWNAVFYKIKRFSFLTVCRYWILSRKLPFSQSRYFISTLFRKEKNL